MSEQSVTVAICTADRPDQLRRTLESLSAQQSHQGMIVLVVDNSATGSARGAWGDFSRHFADKLDYIQVREPGLSRARNAALGHSESAFVAFLDDDVTLPPSWFSALRSGIETPGVVAAGGAIRLAWDSGRPRWMRTEHEKFYSGLDLGKTVRDFAVPTEVPFGANFTVHRSLVARVGGFRTELGRSGKSLRGGEEVDLVLRLAPYGRVRYLPGAWVNHHVSPDRARRRWLLRRYYAQGATNVLMDGVKLDDARPARSSAIELPSPGALPYVLASRLGREAERFRARRAVTLSLSAADGIPMSEDSR